MGAPAISSNKKLGSRTRLITLTQSGANNGTYMFDVPEPLHSMSIHITGTIGGQTVKLKCGNDGNTANLQELPTAVTFASAIGVNTVAQADLGFRHYAIVNTGAGASADIVISIIAKLAY